MHVCVCTYFSAGGGLSKQAEGKNGRKAVLPYFAKSETVSLRRRFSQTALEITTTLPFKVAKQSQALGTWGEESSHICSFTLSQMPRFLLFTLYHGAEREANKNQSRSKKREFLLSRNKAKFDPQFLH